MKVFVILALRKIVWSRLGFSNDKTLTTDKLMVGLMTYILR